MNYIIDDLTGHKCKIIEILDSGLGLRIDDDYLDGYRYSWEVTDVI